MGTRDTYDQALRDLDDRILAMAGHAADAVERAMNALENSNAEEAQEVVEGDDPSTASSTPLSTSVWG